VHGNVARLHGEDRGVIELDQGDGRRSAVMVIWGPSLSWLNAPGRPGPCGGERRSLL
jgi:hypothetical protein